MFSVLTVDDEISICETIADFLKTKGYKVKISQSGEEALEMIEDEKPDIILLDLNMPGMGGEATLREIKKRYYDVPVIMISMIDDENKALELLNAGASDYVPKPIDFLYLEKNLSAWETISKSNLQTEA